LLPREDGTDIGISSPVPLSDEAVSVISKLRNMKDEDEDNARWRDVIFRAKAALSPHSMDLPSRIRIKKKWHGEGNRMDTVEAGDAVDPHSVALTAEIIPKTEPVEEVSQPSPPPPPPLKVDDVSKLSSDLPPGPALYCPECYLPLHPDPRPEKLFIFLHAWKYTTSEWSFSTDMPFWAAEGYQWENEAAEIEDLTAESAGLASLSLGVDD